jgi:hypothetical protein
VRVNGPRHAANCADRVTGCGSTAVPDDAELAKLEAVVRRLLGAVPVVAEDPNGGGR